MVKAISSVPIEQHNEGTTKENPDAQTRQRRTSEKNECDESPEGTPRGEIRKEQKGGKEA